MLGTVENSLKRIPHSTLLLKIPILFESTFIWIESC